MCGIVGVVSQGPVNQLIYDALLLLQHRGQDAAGIATQQGNKFFMHKAKGMVRDVFRTRNMRALPGNVGLGQVRYPTAGNAFSEEEAQPFYVNAPFGIVLVHNGNLTNAHALKAELFNTDQRHINTESDSEVLLNVLADELDKATRGKALDEPGKALLLEDLQSPCTEEVAVFHAFSRVVNEARSSFVVLDTAPTGHSLLLMDATGAYHRQMVQQYEGQAESKGLHIITPLMRLQDGSMTRVIIVTLPEVTPVSQAAAEGALNGLQTVVEAIRLQIENNRAVLLQEMRTFSGARLITPEGTFYALPDLRAFNGNSVELSKFLLKKAFVVTVPGKEFGMEGHIRLSISGSVKDVTEGIARIKWALDPTSPNEIYIGDKKMIRDWM